MASSSGIAYATDSDVLKWQREWDEEFSKVSLQNLEAEVSPMWNLNINAKGIYRV